MTRKQTSKDFPPEFLEAWELAAKEKLNLSFPTKGAAINFRQRLYRFRKLMIDENGQAAFNHWFRHDLVVLEDPTGFFIITTGEPDWKRQVRQQAKEAGVTTPVLPLPTIEHPASTIPEGLGPQKQKVDPSTGKPANFYEKGKQSFDNMPDSQKVAMDEALQKLGFMK